MLRSLGESPGRFQRPPNTTSRRYLSRAGATLRISSGDSVAADADAGVTGPLCDEGAQDEAMTASVISDATARFMSPSLSVLVVGHMLQPLDVFAAYVF